MGPPAVGVNPLIADCFWLTLTGRAHPRLFVDPRRADASAPLASAPHPGGGLAPPIPSLFICCLVFLCNGSDRDPPLLRRARAGSGPKVRRRERQNSTGATATRRYCGAPAQAADRRSAAVSDLLLPLTGRVHPHPWPPPPYGGRPSAADTKWPFLLFGLGATGATATRRYCGALAQAADQRSAAVSDKTHRERPRPAAAAARPRRQRTKGPPP